MGQQSMATDKHITSASDAVAWVWITLVFELTDHFEMATENLAKNSKKVT